MPQILVDGQLVDVSQEEYDALGTGTEATTTATTATTNYEQYALLQAKIEGVKQLAAADSAVVDATNISPEFQAELDRLQSQADALAGDNLAQFQAQYQNESVVLQAQGATNLDALKTELLEDPQPAIVEPGAVPVSSETTIVGGEEITQVNTTDNQPAQTTTVVSETTAVEPQDIEPDTDPQVESPAAEVPALAAADTEPEPVSPAVDPEAPAPTDTPELVTAPPPDAAYQEEQAVQENRWIQAAATNPESIQDNGSVKTDLGDGRTETINRDGSYSISGADGTTYYDAAGQQTAYTTPTVDGFSVTTTSDGIQYTNYTQGPLTTSTITKDGEPISTTVTYDVGPAKISATQVGDGEIVTSTSFIEPSDDPNSAGTLVTTAQVGEGEIVTTETALQTKQQAAAAYQEANAENIKLREDLIAAKQQIDSGTPLSDTQLAALEEQAQATAEADQALAEAEQTLAEEDPTIVAAGEDPQVTEPADQDPLPSLDTVQAAPNDTSTASDPEVAEFEAAQQPEEVPLADIEDAAPEVLAEEDPEVAQIEAAQEQQEVAAADIEESPNEISAQDDPQVAEGAAEPEALVYEAAETPTQDPIVLAQAETTVTDVPVSDIETNDQLTVNLDVDPQLPSPDIAPFTSGLVQEPPLTSPNYVASYNPETGEYDVIDAATGQVADTGLSQEAAELAAETANTIGDPAYPDLQEQPPGASDVVREPTDVDVAEAAFTETGEGFFELQEEAAPQPDQFVETEGGLFVLQEEIQDQVDQEQFEDAEGAEEFGPPYEEPENIDLDQIEYQDTEGAEELSAADIVSEPENIDLDQQYQDEPEGTIQDLNSGERISAEAAKSQAATVQAAADRARAQAVLAAQRKQANDGDWRVKLRLAPQAQYLYRAPNPGILAPLAVTDGVVFPYTPQITTAYKANYASKDLTHSNYRGFFYQGSQVEDIQINAVFTAQDSAEAEYLLAVIHFFRSATKMFYGQDAERGAPPPLVFLQGLGEYQFNLVPCAIAQFNYVLPTDVDYIRAGSPNINGTNLLKRRERQDLPTNPFSSAWSRLKNAGLKKGAVSSPPAPPTLGTNRPTYVPTKIDINVILHPMQSREQISKQFSLKQYANGDLLKGGFW